MYCSHCGKKIDEEKLEQEKNSFTLGGEVVNEQTKVNYVCPQCGHLVHADLSKEEIKSLSRASHAQLQRGANSFATGMSYTALGVILLVIAIIFFTLAHKPSKNFELVTSCAEFYVSMVAFVVSFILLVFGIIKLVVGLNKKIMYTKLLKDINNETFVQ